MGEESIKVSVISERGNGVIDDPLQHAKDLNYHVAVAERFNRRINNPNDYWSPQAVLAEFKYLLDSYDTEMMRTDDFTPQNWYSVILLNALYNDNRDRRIWGNRLLHDEVADDPENPGSPKVLIARRSYHEYVRPESMAEVTERLKIYFRKQRGYSSSVSVLNLNTGVGGSLYALSHSGMMVVENTVEKNRTIHDWTRRSWDRLGLNHVRNWTNDSSENVISNMITSGSRVDLISADHQWSGAFSQTKDPNGYGWEVMDPPLDEVIGDYFQVADHVLVKAPYSMNRQAISDLAKAHDASVTTWELSMKVSDNKTSRELQILFRKNNPGEDYEESYIGVAVNPYI